MNRRDFLNSMGASAGILLVEEAAMAAAAETCAPAPVRSGLRGESQGFFEIRHQHEFYVPVEVLAYPPVEGYSARSSTPLKGRTDFQGLKNRTDSAGKPLDLREHAHTVTLTQEDLVKLSQGRFVVVKLEKFGHQFYFCADDRTLGQVRTRQAGA